VSQPNATATRPAPVPSSAGGRPPGFWDTVHSEWTKLRTLRSTTVTLAVAALLVIGIGGLLTLAVYSAPTHGKRVQTDPVALIQIGWFFGLLTLMVLGVLVISNEYSSGMIVSTLLATPKRARLLLAKVTALSALLLIVCEVMSFINFFVGSAVISAFPRFFDPSIGDHNVLRAVIGMGLDGVLAALMGLGLGALLRNAAAAIAIGVGIIFVEPIISQLLPSSIQNPLNEYWPTEAGGQLEEVNRQAHSLTAWWGTGDLVLFIALLLVAAGYGLVKRDA
jgi:ABC-2 type transport system permease protein